MSFRGTERYHLLRRIGQGGMGVVFLAWDRQRQEEVALKTLLKGQPGTLYQFKQEFRALADVVHPNLVALHEMGVADGEWFFTMELVRGVSFLERVWGGAATTADADTLTAMGGTTVSGHLAGAPRLIALDALRA